MGNAYNIGKEPARFIVLTAIDMIESGKAERTCLAIGRAARFAQDLYPELQEYAGLACYAKSQWESFVKCGHLANSYMQWWDEDPTPERQAARLAALKEYLAYVEQTGELES